MKSSAKYWLLLFLWRVMPLWVGTLIYKSTGYLLSAILDKDHKPIKVFFSKSDYFKR